MNVEAMVDEMRSPEHCLPLESTQSIHRASPALCKEHDCSILPDASKTETITENGKVIVKSRYFQKKQVSQNHLEDKQLKFCSTGGIANEFPESGNPDSCGNTYFKGMTSKRKISSIECIETVSAFTFFSSWFYNTFFFLVFLD